MGTGNTCAPIAGRQEGPNRMHGTVARARHTTLLLEVREKHPTDRKTVHSQVGTRVPTILTLPRWPPASVHAPPVACGTVTMVRCVATTAQLRLDSIVKLWFTNLGVWDGVSPPVKGAFRRRSGQGCVFFSSSPLVGLRKARVDAVPPVAGHSSPRTCIVLLCIHCCNLLVT